MPIRTRPEARQLTARDGLILGLLIAFVFDPVLVRNFVVAVGAVALVVACVAMTAHGRRS